MAEEGLVQRLHAHRLLCLHAALPQRRIRHRVTRLQHRGTETRKHSASKADEINDGVQFWGRARSIRA